jgi:hypothetical protein
VLSLSGSACVKGLLLLRPPQAAAGRSLRSESGQGDAAACCGSSSERCSSGEVPHLGVVELLPDGRCSSSSQLGITLELKWQAAWDLVQHLRSVRQCQLR